MTTKNSVSRARSDTASPDEPVVCLFAVERSEADRVRRSSPQSANYGCERPAPGSSWNGRFFARRVAPPETPCDAARGCRAVPGDRRPSKRKSRAERERIEYAVDALGWLHEQLEPPPQPPPADPPPPPPRATGPRTPEAGHGRARPPAARSRPGRATGPPAARGPAAGCDPSPAGPGPSPCAGRP